MHTKVLCLISLLCCFAPCLSLCPELPHVPNYPALPYMLTQEPLTPEMASNDQPSASEQSTYEYSLVRAPPVSSPAVIEQKKNLLGSVDLEALVNDLGRLGNCVRIAYHGVAGFVDLQIQIQRIGYNVTKLASKSSLTVGRFKTASFKIVSVLESTYKYLLDCLEEVAVDTLSDMAEIAKEMADAAKELSKDFEKQSESVIATLEETQRTHGTEQNRKDQMERDRAIMEVEKKRVVQLHEVALEYEQKYEVLRKEAQRKEDYHLRTLDNFGSSLINALTSNFLGIKVIDMEVHADAAKEAKKEKIEHLKTVREEQEKRREALERMAEVAQQMVNLQDNENQVEAAIDALQNAIQALKSLSSIMIKASNFWEQMQFHCVELAKDKLRKKIVKYMSKSKEERYNIWSSEGFRGEALQYYAGWVALDDVCGTYIDRITKTEKELHSYIQEALEPDEAHKLAKALAIPFIADLRKEQAAIAEKQFQQQAEVEALKKDTN